jgi:hypothetical protein
VPTAAVDDQLEQPVREPAALVLDFDVDALRAAGPPAVNACMASQNAICAVATYAQPLTSRLNVTS